MILQKLTSINRLISNNFSSHWSVRKTMETAEVNYKFFYYLFRWYVLLYVKLCIVAETNLDLINQSTGQHNKTIRNSDGLPEKQMLI